MNKNDKIVEARLAAAEAMLKTLAVRLSSQEATVDNLVNAVARLLEWKSKMTVGV